MEYIEIRDELQAQHEVSEMEMGRGMAPVMKREPALRTVQAWRPLVPSFFIGLALLSMVEVLQWRYGGCRWDL